MFRSTKGGTRVGSEWGAEQGHEGVLPFELGERFLPGVPPDVVHDVLVDLVGWQHHHHRAQRLQDHLARGIDAGADVVDELFVDLLGV